MNSVQSAWRAVGYSLLVGAAMLSGGCAEELGPVPMPVARVQGLVREGDHPISGGWIEFLPTEGTVGNLRSAPLRPDGTFVADGVAVGTNAIRLVNAPIEADFYQRLFSVFYSPIRRVITSGPSEPLDINLVEEAIKFQNDRKRAVAGPRSPEGEGP